MYFIVNRKGIIKFFISFDSGQNLKFRSIRVRRRIIVTTDKIKSLSNPFFLKFLIDLYNSSQLFKYIEIIGFPEIVLIFYTGLNFSISIFHIKPNRYVPIVPF